MRTSLDISSADEGQSTSARESCDKGRTLVDLAKGAPAQEGAQLGQGGRPGARGARAQQQRDAMHLVQIAAAGPRGHAQAAALAAQWAVPPVVQLHSSPHS